MATISINVGDFGARSMVGDRVVFYAPLFRKSADGERVVSTAPRQVELDGGKGRVEGVDPGPLMVEFVCRNITDSGPFRVVVPNDGSFSLHELLTEAYHYEPEIIGEVNGLLGRASAVEARIRELTSEAEAAAGRVGSAEQVGRWASEAEASAGRAEGAAGRADSSAQAASASAEAASESASAAAVSVDSARVQAEAAARSAQEASESSGAAGVSAAAARGDADRAAEQAQSANAAVSQAGEARDAASQSAGQAGEHARAAAASAVTAGEHADSAQRSAEQAGEAAADASVSAVAAKVEELTRDAPEAFDTLAEIAAELEEGTSARAALTKQIAEKADLEHTHTTADVEGLESALATKAEKSHTHTTSQIDGLDAALADKAGKSHTHEMSQVTGLSDALAGKAAKSHTHTISQVDGLENRLGGIESQLPKIQVVDAMPSSPDASTLYLVKEA